MLIAFLGLAIILLASYLLHLDHSTISLITRDRENSKVVRRFVQARGLGENRFIWLHNNGSVSMGIYGCTATEIIEYGTYKLNGNDLSLHWPSLVNKSLESLEITTTMSLIAGVSGFYPRNETRDIPYLDEAERSTAMKRRDETLTSPTPTTP